MREEIPSGRCDGVRNEGMKEEELEAEVEEKEKEKEDKGNKGKEEK